MIFVKKSLAEGLFTLLLILIVELLNSAIEAVVDRISTEHHELSKEAKDIGCSAVFLTIATAVISWAIVLLQI
jgi:diacylglycerol kinase (ATP)